MKKVLYVIAAIAAIYLVCCVIGPSSVKVEKSATINAPADVVKAQIVDYNVFNTWSPWAEKDPNMKVSVEGTPGTVGHKYNWEGNDKVKKGSMTLKKVDGDTLIEELNFDGRGTSDVFFTLKPDGNGTNVSWWIEMKSGFFGRGMMLFMKGMIEKGLGGDFEKGLANMKKVAEAAAAKPATANYEVKEITWEEAEFLGSKAANLNMEKMPAFFGENFPKLFGDLTKNNIKPMSAPASICFKWDDASMSGDMAAVIRVPKGTKVKGWENYTTPACKVLQVEYFGDYNKIGAAHEAMGKFMKEKNLTNGWVFEEYVTDPGTEKDTTKWQTNVYYVLNK
ncbi:MAG: SRPBCC family protein [Bacteroidia bacterium]